MQAHKNAALLAEHGSKEAKKFNEDLGIKIVSKERKLWLDVERNAKSVLEQAKEQVIIQEEIVLLAERKLLEHKQ